MKIIFEPWVYSLIGFLLFLFGLLLAGISKILGFLIVINGILLCVTSFLYSISSNFRLYIQSVIAFKDTFFDRDNFDTDDRNISTEGGTYNENIQGDSINIQGSTIYLGQDLSDFSDRLSEVLTQVKDTNIDIKVLKREVINELKYQISQNHRVRNKILRWKEPLGLSNYFSIDNRELAENLVNFTINNHSSLNDFIFVFKGRYKKLHNLLQAQKWQEADFETVQVIQSLMPYPEGKIEIDQIPPQDLRKINKLWVQASHGKFGFSVQQKIWLKLLQVYDYNENSFWFDCYYCIDESVYQVFVDEVGWSREENRIYHKNLKYSIRAQRGHFPAALFFNKLYYYDYNSNYYTLNDELFYAIMKREYYKVPFIPSWLEDWLPID